MLGRATSVDPGDRGHRVHAASLRLLGMPTRAVFYFDSADGGLVGGKYLSEPSGVSCVAQFRTLRLLVASSVGEARMELLRGTGGDAPSDRAACRRFVESSRPHDRWAAAFVDPVDGDTLALVRLLRRDGGPRLMACYRVTADCRWPEDPGIDPGPVLGPARGDTAGGELD